MYFARGYHTVYIKFNCITEQNKIQMSTYFSLELATSKEKANEKFKNLYPPEVRRYSKVIVLKKMYLHFVFLFAHEEPQRDWVMRGIGT
jgi:hypothetical protein